MAPGREIVLDFEDLPSVTCDRGRIGQVIDNLISKALKFSPSEVPVTVRAWAGDDHVEVSVTDQGAGIADTQLSQLF